MPHNTQGAAVSGGPDMRFLGLRGQAEEGQEEEGEREGEEEGDGEGE